MKKRPSAFQQTRLRDKKRKILFYKIGGVLLTLVFIVFVLSLVTRAGFVKVASVDVTGSKIVPKEAIENIVASVLNTNDLKIFSKNNFALFPRAETEAKIHAAFPQIATVSVAFDGLKKIAVNVDEYEPAFLWCATLSRERCYFMDKNGYIFSESADFSKSVLFTYYGLINPDVPGAPLGQTYLLPAKFAELNHFVESMKQLKLSPVGLNARSEDDSEIFLDSGGSVIFSNHEDFLTTFENLETIIAAQTAQDKDFLSKLDYIDVRFNSKAFVKLK